MIDGNEECRCENGFKNKNDDSLLPCEDIDECELGFCGFGSCVNSIGSYTCSCPEGFEQGEGEEQCRTCKDGFKQSESLESCQDIDECKVVDCGQGQGITSWNEPLFHNAKFSTREP